MELALPVTLVDLQNATLLQRKGGGMLFNTVKDIEIEVRRMREEEWVAVRDP